MTFVTKFNRRLPEGLVSKLEIGCGERKQKGFVGIDLRDCGQEIVWDVREGIPLPDGSVDEIISSHTIEHFSDDEVREVFKEIYRVLKNGGTTYHILPHVDDPRAYYFDHKTFWNEDRIVSMIGVPGLEGFIIKQNHSTTEKNLCGMKELEFELVKT
jgi:predicted SAM-dependent methyltransferase